MNVYEERLVNPHVSTVTDSLVMVVGVSPMTDVYVSNEGWSTVSM